MSDTNNTTDREKDLFNQAIELSTPEVRATFLKGACGADERLHQRMQLLLAAHEAAGGFIPTKDGEETVLASTRLAEGPGTRIGRYKLLQQIGEGGMGVVYMAEQEEPVRRRVALKIIKLGMDTKQVVARFEAERQALALMDHPNIAKVLDGGSTEDAASLGTPASLPAASGNAGLAGRDAGAPRDTGVALPAGRPYFVMELVQGVPISEFCDKARLSAKERLKLFILVCQAIQHAHQKGIIHRDIKPSNVMVTLHDSVPVPKVIDFGIAKATNQKLTEKTLFTNFATMIGTPAYMSPEQAEMSGLDIDTRTDIYALGVLLYALLTGTTPFPEKRLRSLGYGEMQRIIREEEPEPPSTRLSTMANEQKTIVAKNCGEELVSLSNLLKGDLDWIVMKCLEKDRQRRYETANGLASDIQRHLSNQPVIARPPSTAYRFQKMVRRNKGVAAAAGIVALAVALGLVGTSWQAIRAIRAERVSQSEALRATQQATRASEAEKVALDKSAVADRERTAAEASLYAAHMNLAQTELAAGNLRVAKDLLEQHRPKPDQRDLRGWEWRYLWQQCRSDEAFTLGNHQERLTGLAFSIDGRLLATADVGDSSDIAGSKVLLWDFASRKLLSPPVSENAAGSVAFSPDGRLLAFGTLQDEIMVIDVLTRAEVAKFPGRQQLSHNNALQFSPDGKLLAVGDKTHSIALYEIATQQKRVSMIGHERGVRSAAFFPDGTKLVSGSADHSVRLWDVSTGRLLNTWTNHTSDVQGVAVSPDGQSFASASWDGTICIRNVATGEEVASVISTEAGWASSVAFSPDGKTIACGGNDHSIRIWDATTAKELRKFRGSRDEVMAVAFSPDGKALVSGSKDGVLKAWSTAPKQAEIAFLPKLPDWTSSTLSCDGRWLMELTTNRMCRVIEIPSGREIVRYSFPAAFTDAVCFAISPDGVKLAYGTRSGAVGVLNALTGNSIRPLAQLAEEVSSLKFSRDGKVLAASDRERVILWDAISHQAFASFQHTAKFGSSWGGITLSRDGRQLLTRCEDGRAELLSETTQKFPTVWNAHRGLIMDAVFFPDARRVVTAGADARVKVWDLETKQEFLIGSALNAFWSVTLNDEGTRLVAGAGEGLIRIYDPVRAHLLLALKSEASIEREVKFLPGDDTLVAIVPSGLRIWRAPSWAEIEAVEKAESITP